MLATDADKKEGPVPDGNRLWLTKRERSIEATRRYRIQKHLTKELAEDYGALPSDVREGLPFRRVLKDHFGG